MGSRLVKKPTIIYPEIHGLPEEAPKDILTTVIELSGIESNGKSVDTTTTVSIETAACSSSEVGVQQSEEELLAPLPGEENIKLDPNLDVNAILEQPGPLVISQNSAFTFVQPSTRSTKESNQENHNNVKRKDSSNEDEDQATDESPKRGRPT